jgi:hypothetical protein
MASVEETEPKVVQALAEGKYDFPAFLDVLRAYQFRPSSFNVQLASRVLLASLVQFERNDFGMALCLIADKQHETPEIRALCALEGHLERGQYLAFWASYAESKALFGEPLPNLEPTVRANMVQSLAQTFQAVSVAVAGEALNAKAAELPALVGKLGKVEGDRIVFVANAFNTPPPAPEKRELTSQDIAAMINA